MSVVARWLLTTVFAAIACWTFDRAYARRGVVGLVLMVFAAVGSLALFAYLEWSRIPYNDTPLNFYMRTAVVCPAVAGFVVLSLAALKVERAIRIVISTLAWLAAFGLLLYRFFTV